jgi:hypothetical protein
MMATRLAPEPVEAVEEQGVGDGDPQEAAEKEESDRPEGDVGEERLTQDGHRRGHEGQGQDVLEEVEADGVDGAAADPEQDDGHGPDEAREKGQDLARRAGGQERVDPGGHVSRVLSG